MLNKQDLIPFATADLPKSVCFEAYGEKMEYGKTLCMMGVTLLLFAQNEIKQTYQHVNKS